MHRSVLSFDCANKSLAYCHITIDIKNINIFIQEFNTLSNNIKLKSNASERTIEENSLIEIFVLKFSDTIKINKCGVIDVIPELKIKETDKILRTKCLKNVLNSINFELSTEDLILVEEQPRTKNDKSHIVESQLLMYYADYDIYVVDPRLKNNIHFSAELHHDLFLAKYNDSYRANKEHTKANFLYFLKIFGQEKKISAIPKERYSDIADAFEQILGFLVARF